MDALDITGYLGQADTPTRIDDANTGYATYDPSWSRWDASGYWAAYKDTYAFTDQATYKVTFTFYGTYLSWVSRTANTQGKAKVTLDGNDAEAVTIDLYSPSTLWKKSVYSTGLLPDDTHTVTIECLGTKNPASWWYSIGVDAFDIMRPTTSQADAGLTVAQPRSLTGGRRKAPPGVCQSGWRQRESLTRCWPHGTLTADKGGSHNPHSEAAPESRVGWQRHVRDSEPGGLHEF